MRWPDGFFIDYTYDAVSRLQSINEQASSTLANYQYDDLNLRKQLTLGNNTTTNSRYTHELRLQELSHHYTNADRNISLTHSYNQIGQILTQNKSNYLYNWIPAASETRTYNSNGLNQYTGITGVPQQHDGNGNLNSDGQWTLQKMGSSLSMTYLFKKMSDIYVVRKGLTLVFSSFFLVFF